MTELIIAKAKQGHFTPVKASARSSRNQRDSSSHHEFNIPGVDEFRVSLFMPFARQRNPHGDWAARQNIDWLLSMGILEPGSPELRIVERAAFPELAALVHDDDEPHALALVANFISFLFFFDDMVDSAESDVGTDSSLTRLIADRMMAGVRGQSVTVGTPALPLTREDRARIDALQRMLADISHRLRAYTPRIEPFIETVGEYLDGVVDEAHLRGLGIGFSTVQFYSDLRVLVSGVRPCLDLGAIVRGIEVPPSVRETEAFARARRACNLNCSYVNDLFSYKKEALMGEASNVVMVLEQAGVAHNMRDTLNDACGLTSRTVLDYLAASRELDDSDAGTRGYLRLMQNWMRGNLDWCLEANHRYVEASTTSIVDVRADSLGL